MHFFYFFPFLNATWQVHDGEWAGLDNKELGGPNLIPTLHVDEGHALFLTQEKMVVRVGGDGFEGRTKTILTANFLLLN